MLIFLVGGLTLMPLAWAPLFSWGSGILGPFMLVSAAVLITAIGYASSQILRR